ncbi:MAG: hypothetical protein K0Q79_17 [Flavipsychrobacter sp.]|jgi:hypothetical protein|nr:hypothetical protein [Flavipsychrobacter sp.]
MKKIILAVLLPFICVSGYAQNTIFGFWGGLGASVNHSYDLSTAGGFTFIKHGRSRIGIGADLFYQSFPFKYDKEAYGLKNGTSNAGMIIQGKPSYIFVTPKFTGKFGKGGNFEFYATAGAGFKMGGTETMRKWDRTNGVTAGDYDSTIDTSPNINSMVMRLGVGATQYIWVGKKWFFTVAEDLGFVASSLTKSSDVTNPSRTIYSPSGKLNPFFISVYIGFRHMSNVSYTPPPRNKTKLGGFSR